MNRQTTTSQSLLLYFTLAFGISWITWFPLYSPAFGIKNLPLLPFHHGLGGLGPMIAALITTWFFEGAPGISRLVGQMGKVTPVRYIVIAVFAPFVLAVAASAIDYFLNGNPIQLSGLFTAKEFPGFSFVSFFLYNLLFFGFGEETGWRGFALPRLQTRYNALLSGLILTAFWAIWHWPLFLYRPGFLDMGVADAFGWVISLLTGCILLTWLYNASKASILVCAVFHTTVDIVFLADFTDPNIVGYMGMLITVWGIITIFIFKPKHLAGTERIKHRLGAARKGGL